MKQGFRFGAAEVIFNLSLDAVDAGLARGGRQLFQSLSFHLDPGEMLLVTGPNASGKSSLLRAIAGLLRLSSGYFQSASAGLPEKERPSLPEQTHFIGHSNALKSQLTALENLEFWQAFLSPAAADTLTQPVKSLLPVLGLAHLAQVPVAYFSAGQARRLALLRLLVVNRPVWLLDEPVNALDESSRRRIAGLMDQHRAKGGLIIVASHDELGVTPSKRLRLGPEL